MSTKTRTEKEMIERQERLLKKIIKLIKPEDLVLELQEGETSDIQCIKVKNLKGFEKKEDGYITMIDYDSYSDKIEDCFLHSDVSHFFSDDLSAVEMYFKVQLNDEAYKAKMKKQAEAFAKFL